MALQRILGLALLCHGVISSVPGADAAHALAQRAAPRRLHGRFLHITGQFNYPIGPYLFGSYPVALSGTSQN